ncbi:MAG TPA: hypothetical protein VGT78_03455 [Rhizomicrobium sp.]|nr:hypothetical protein [Rhizomicrobium sp.]
MDDDALLRSIPAIMARLPKMSRQELVTVWCHAVEMQSKDAVLTKAIERLLDAVDAAFADPNRRGDPLEEGPLALLGYHVGDRANLAARQRQARLSAIYRRAIPPVFPPHYLADWGSPGTPARLERMAYSIISFIRDPKRRKDPRMEDAITEWKEDLDYLRSTHYRGEFYWPAP